MANTERGPLLHETPDFEAVFDDGFDINAAFQSAMQEVASDEELALEEKVRRMEVIITEGVSDEYRDFVDFRAMAAHMEMMCSHDHTLSESIQGSETLAGFMDRYKDDGRGYQDEVHGRHGHDRAAGRNDSKNKKKKKKSGWTGWFGIRLTYND